MPPSAPPSARPAIRRDFLERLDRALLVRLVTPHADTLAAHGFPFAALSCAEDRSPLNALFDLFEADSPSASDPALLPLLTLLGNVCRVATAAGRESLIKLDKARVLPARKGAEDLAAIAALDHPELFAAVRVGSAVDAIRGFLFYQAHADREPSFQASDIERTRQLLAAWFAARHRTAVCEIHVKHRGPELHFEIGHGKTPQTQELIDESLARKIVTQVNVDRSYAFYNVETRLLAVHALEFIKNGLRTCFGAGCGGDADFFSPAEALLDVSPLRDLDEALAPDLALGVASVDLRELEAVFSDGTSALYCAPKGDLRTGSRRRAINESLSEDGARVSQLKMAVNLVGAKRPLLVVIKADRNQLEYDRRDAWVEKVLLAWLGARGIWQGSRRLSSIPAPLDVPGLESTESSAAATA